MVLTLCSILTLNKEDVILNCVEPWKKDGVLRPLTCVGERCCSFYTTNGRWHHKHSCHRSLKPVSVSPEKLITTFLSSFKDRDNIFINCAIFFWVCSTIFFLLHRSKNYMPHFIVLSHIPTIAFCNFNTILTGHPGMYRKISAEVKVPTELLISVQ